jgi:lipoprotein-anchoring transpeptidase ErfK/SrfK
MGRHSRTGRPPARAAVAVCGLTLGVFASVAVGQAQAGPDVVPGTPCTAAAAACVSIDSKQAWLIADGAVVRGPVPTSVGAPGRDTPRGDFVVEWKHAEHRSSEFNNAPMPWAVFFAEGGIAFHEGNLASPSAGCVRLGPEDARAFYEFLGIGAPVEVR